MVRTMGTDPCSVAGQPCNERPDGDGSRPKTISRGIGAALSAIRTLNRNRQLLGFTLLAGLVVAGIAIGQAILPFADWPLRPYIAGWLVLNFLLTFATLFLLVFLLAGLVLSIPPENGAPASFCQGLCGTKHYIKPLVSWSILLACAGLLLFVTYHVVPAGLWRELGFVDTFEPNNLLCMLSQFPFNFTLDPRIFQELPGGIFDGRSLLILLYDSGFTNALIVSAIALFLFAFTPFVIPLIVLEQKSLRDAVAGSFALLKKAWAEVALCAVFLMGIVLAVSLTYLLVQAVHGMVVPSGTYSPAAWVVLGILYDTGLSAVALVVATAGGIALRDLYLSAKHRHIPGP